MPSTQSLPRSPSLLGSTSEPPHPHSLPGFMAQKQLQIGLTASAIFILPSSSFQRVAAPQLWLPTPSSYPSCYPSWVASSAPSPLLLSLCLSRPMLLLATCVCVCWQLRYDLVRSSLNGLQLVLNSCQEIHFYNEYTHTHACTHTHTHTQRERGSKYASGPCKCADLSMYLGNCRTRAIEYDDSNHLPPSTCPLDDSYINADLSTV